MKVVLNTDINFNLDHIPSTKYQNHIQGLKTQQKDDNYDKLFISIPYVPTVSDIIINTWKVAIRKHFPYLKIQFCYKPCSTFNYTNLSLNTYNPNSEKSIIYQAKCIECNKIIYIGETYRNLGTREKEHKTKNSKTPVGNHIKNTNHQINFKKMLSINDVYLRKLVESCLISKFNTITNTKINFEKYLNLNFADFIGAQW